MSKAGYSGPLLCASLFLGQQRNTVEDKCIRRLRIIRNCVGLTTINRSVDSHTLNNAQVCCLTGVRSKKHWPQGAPCLIKPRHVRHMAWLPVSSAFLSPPNTLVLACLNREPSGSVPSWLQAVPILQRRHVVWGSRTSR